MANALTKIKTGAIADDAVTLAKQAAGTDGQIITYDASGNPTAVGPGSDGQVLTSTGAGSPPAFETPAASVGGAAGVDFNDNVKIRSGTGNDLEIYHDGTNSHIDNNTGELRLNSASAIKLYHNDTLLYYTESDKLRCGDNIKLDFGNVSDLSIYHNGTDSVIDNSTGKLRILSDQFRFNNAANDETCILADANGAVQLYYDGVKKFETDSGGVVFGDDFFVSDSNIGYFGSGNDLQIKHDGTHSRIHNNTGILLIEGDGNVEINKGASSENMAKFTCDGSVELYYDNAKKLETSSGGISVTGGINLSTNLSMVDNGLLKLGTSDDLEIKHSGTNSYITHANTGNLYVIANSGHIAFEKGAETLAKFIPDGAVELYHNNVKKLWTESWGVSIDGDFGLGDNEKLICGGSDDFQIFHDASHNYIKGVTASQDLYLQGMRDIYIKSGDNAGGYQTAIYMDNNGGVTLKYDDSTKLATTNTGITVTGNIFVGTNGKGISFESSNNNGIGGTSSLLDDYEEGTYTLSLLAADGATITAHRASYIKIGALVKITGSFTVTGTSGNQARLAVPFTSNINGYYAAHGTICASTDYSDGDLVCTIENGGPYMIINTHNGMTAQTWNNIGTNRLDFDISYERT